MRSGSFDGMDGLRLHFQLYPTTKKPRGLVVVVHGYADHAGRYAEVAERLVDEGYAAMAFDYRGHGRAQGSRGHCDRFEELISDLARACAHARREVPDAPLALLAHSHGALMSLYALLGGAVPGVRAAVLTSPYLGLKMKVSPVKVFAGRIASRVLPRLAMASGLDPATFTHDATIVAATRADPLCHKVATARWFTEMQAAQERVARDVHRLSVPTLWLVAGADPVVDSAVTERVYAHAGPDENSKSIVVYDGFFHEILNEVDRARVHRDLLAWLAPRFPAS